MRLLRFLQLVDVGNAQVELAGGDHVEHVVGTPLELFARGGVVEEGGARKEERSFLGKLDGIKGRNRPAGAAEKGNVPTGTHDVQVLFEGALAHSVVDDVDSFAISDSFGFGLKVLLGIDDYIVGSGITS